MERMRIKKIKEENNIEIIESIMKMNNGYITSKELDNYGVHRMYLNIMWKKGAVEKVGNGIYIDSSKIEDSYYIFGLSMPNIIYSHMTALYFHGLSINAPNDIYDITVKKLIIVFILKTMKYFMYPMIFTNLVLLKLKLLWAIK